MPKPAELISRALRPARQEPPKEAPPAPSLATTIERRTVLPNGDVELYRFDPQRGETTEIIPAAEVRWQQTAGPSEVSPADRLAVETQLREQGLS